MQIIGIYLIAFYSTFPSSISKDIQTSSNLRKEQNKSYGDFLSNPLNSVLIGSAELMDLSEAPVLANPPILTSTSAKATIGPTTLNEKQSSIFVPDSSLLFSNSQHIKMESMIGGYSNRFEKGLRAPGSQMHTVVFAIQKLRMDELRSILDDISNPFSTNYGNHLTRAEVTKITSNPEGSRKVLQFLENHSHSSGEVEVLEMTPNKDYITARATVAHWEEIFKAEFHYYHSKKSESQQRAEPLIRASEYSLPSEVALHVLGVFNVVDLLSNAKPKVVIGPSIDSGVISKSSVLGPTGTIVPNFVTPALLSKVYRIDSNIGNSLVSQGVYETLNQWFSPSDLTVFENFMGIANQKVAVTIGGHSSDTACQVQGSDNCAEGNLDVQYMIGVSQVTPTTYYYSTDTQFMLDWLLSVAAMTSPPLVLSVSWGEPESDITASYLTSVNNEAIILSTMGVTLIVASGDDGANTRTACGYAPDFPSGSAYFTAVGATNGPQAGRAEVTCQSDLNGGVITSGGGISNLYRATSTSATSSIPYWQNSQVTNYFSTVSPKPAAGYQTAGRGYPDVSLLGNAYITYIAGSQQSLSGTSASAPVFAGMVSLVNAARKAAGKSSLGWLNPALYAFSSKFILNDITSGNNKCNANKVCCSQGFTAAPGWDPVTGLGSVNFTAFKKVFLSLTDGSQNSFSPSPAPAPVRNPTVTPTPITTVNPTKTPVQRPTAAPTSIPSAGIPRVSPTMNPTLLPTSAAPSRKQTNNPTVTPSIAAPSRKPTSNPTVLPSIATPSTKPSKNPTVSPSITAVPVKNPTVLPTTQSTASTSIGDGCVVDGVIYSINPGFYCKLGRSYVCPVGYFCPGGSGGYGYRCRTGTFADTIGLSSCVSNGATVLGGSCVSNGQQFNCVARGTFCQNLLCSYCPVGYYCPVGINAYSCPPGTTATTTANVACIPSSTPVVGDGCIGVNYYCSSGKYCVGSSCKTCPSGDYCPSSQGSYGYACPAGTSSKAGAASCH